MPTLRNPKPIEYAINRRDIGFFIELINALLQPLYSQMCDCKCGSAYLYYHSENCPYRRTILACINRTDRQVRNERVQKKLKKDFVRP